MLHMDNQLATFLAMFALLGITSTYIEKQIHNFQSGARTHQIMSAMAKND